MLDHLGGDIGVQVEADDQRQVFADHLAQAREKLTFVWLERVDQAIATALTPAT